MKITVASSNRSHLLDAAKALAKEGYDVTFISFTPIKRLKKYGIPDNLKCKSVFGYCIIGILLTRFFPSDFSREILRRMLDYSVSWKLKDTDVFICQSPHFEKTMHVAKEKYGAEVILDRGSTHVRYYNEQLKKAKARSMREWYLKFDSAQYEFADTICVASTFCKKTMMEYGICEEKIFVNPYGADLASFYPTELDKDCYDVIYVGNLSKNKGSDILLESCRKYGYSLLHVGAIVDVAFPTVSNFCHIDPVREFELINYYKKAKVFVMPTRNDGFGLVLIQAAACGLPIVTSKFSGGLDLKSFLQNTSYIQIMDDLTSDCLGQEIAKLLNFTEAHSGVRCYADNLKEQLSWKAYAKRYIDFFRADN